MHEYVERETIGPLTLTIYADEDPGNPRTEWDNLGTMILCGSYAWQGDKHGWGEKGWDEWGREASLPKRIEESAGPILFLPIHGRCPSRGGMFAGAPGDWDPDTCDGMIYVSLADVRREYSCKRVSAKVRGQALSVLRGEVETQDQYLTGEVFGYVLEDPQGEHVDSCWGYYGIDYARQEARDTAAWYSTQEPYASMPGVDEEGGS